MRRNLEHVKHLLDLIQAYADKEGIYYSDLVEKWEQSGGSPNNPLAEPECNYLTDRCAEAGFITIKGGMNLVQLTWHGHEYLDSVTPKPN